MFAEHRISVSAFAGKPQNDVSSSSLEDGRYPVSFWKCQHRSLSLGLLRCCPTPRGTAVDCRFRLRPGAEAGKKRRQEPILRPWRQPLRLIPVSLRMQVRLVQCLQ